MANEIKEAVEKVKRQSARPTVSASLSDGSLVETIYRPEEDRTLFCVAKDGEIRYETNILDQGERLVPYSPKNHMLRNEVVLLPSEPAEYESEEALVGAIRAHLRRYVDVSPLFEEIASYYVLFTWVYDAFNELPYLRLRGDTGSGKTRFLLTAGSLCYKPIFASGASTVSPLFRILDEVRGTLIVDEGDFRFSDEKAEIVKILNNGNARGFPVLRSESVQGKEFRPRAYTVFGPKIVATRGYFQDRALESRCLTEEMGGRRLRDDIPINLTSEPRREARDIRNKLLTFRLRSLSSRQIDPTLVDRTIEPRLAQVFVPLMSIIENPEARDALRKLAREYNRELVTDRGLDTEAQVLDIIHLLQTAYETELSIKEITNRFIERHEGEYAWKITPKWIGTLIRRKLNLKTQKRHGVFVIAPSEAPRLERLYEKYGIGRDEADGSAPDLALAGDLGDVGDVAQRPDHGTGT